jgi:hypothetical protein
MRFGGLAAGLLALCATDARVAEAGEPIQMGGRHAMVVNGSIVTTTRDVEKTEFTGTTVTTDEETETETAWTIGATYGYITPGALFEFGGSLFLVASGLGGDNEFVAVSPAATGRINTPAFGPTRNMLFYAGGNVGLTYFAIEVQDGTGGTDVEESTVFSTGPKGGFEAFVTPRVAIQIEDAFTFNFGSDADLLGKYVNRVSIGAKILF